MLHNQSQMGNAYQRIAIILQYFASLLTIKKCSSLFLKETIQDSNPCTFFLDYRDRQSRRVSATSLSFLKLLFVVENLYEEAMEGTNRLFTVATLHLQASCPDCPSFLIPATAGSTHSLYFVLRLSHLAFDFYLKKTLIKISIFPILTSVWLENDNWPCSGDSKINLFKRTSELRRLRKRCYRCRRRRRLHCRRGRRLRKHKTSSTTSD